MDWFHIHFQFTISCMIYCVLNIIKFSGVGVHTSKFCFNFVVCTYYLLILFCFLSVYYKQIQYPLLVEHKQFFVMFSFSDVSETLYINLPLKCIKCNHSKMLFKGTHPLKCYSCPEYCKYE